MDLNYFINFNEREIVKWEAITRFTLNKQITEGDVWAKQICPIQFTARLIPNCLFYLKQIMGSLTEYYNQVEILIHRVH